MDTQFLAFQDGGHYELRFRPLFDAHRGYAFPCDEEGRVDIDTLSDRARNSYLYARALVGWELSRPDVERVAA
ncbi:MAG TPA: hypothetical protein VLI72_12900 [Methylibium sp.]|nr:hypothetical protein [Methylibium sp.]